MLVDIGWNNDQHLLQLAEHVDEPALLFWLSLTPFVAAWMGEHRRKSAPMKTYGVVLLGAAIECYLLTRALLAGHGSTRA